MPASRRSDEFSDKYLTIELGGGTCGLAVLKVREILGLRAFYPLADSPAYVRGAISLRGRTVPVVDLRTRFHFPDTYCNRTCLIVSERWLDPDRTTELAYIVDGVGDVVSVAGRTVTPAAAGPLQAATTAVLGQVSIEGRTITLLDLDQLVPADLAADLTRRAAAAAPPATFS